MMKGGSAKKAPEAKKKKEKMIRGQEKKRREECRGTEGEILGLSKESLRMEFPGWSSRVDPETKNESFLSDLMTRNDAVKNSLNKRAVMAAGVCLVCVLSYVMTSFTQLSSSWNLVTFAEASDSDATYHYPHLKELWEFQTQLITTGATNAIMILGVTRSWYVGCPIDAILGFAAMVTSVVYHTLQTLEGNNPRVYGKAFFLAGDEADWHRADNIFAITCIITFFVMPLQLVSPLWNLLSRIVPLCVVTVSQCLRPWNFAFTLYPIVFFGVSYLVAFATMKDKPHLEWRSCIYSAVCFAFAVVFFFLGMDDENDYLRIYHGFWHIFVGLFVYYWTGACNPPHIIQARKRLLFATQSDATKLLLLSSSSSSSSQDHHYKKVHRAEGVLAYSAHHSSTPRELQEDSTPTPPSSSTCTSRFSERGAK